MSPFYDKSCLCGWIGIDVLERVNETDVACPDCGLPTKRIWITKPPTAIGDELDHVQVNGLREPRRFTSKIERARWMKENGFRDCTRHVGEDGTDKSRHTTRWATMDKYTLQNAKELLERASQQPARNDPQDRLHITHSYGTATRGKDGRMNLVPDGN
jgi:hypothetical protein